MGTCNRHVKFGLKIPNRLGKSARKFQGGLTHTVHYYDTVQRLVVTACIKTDVNCIVSVLLLYLF